MVKNCSPKFIWCASSKGIDIPHLEEYQMVNHYRGVESFVTKVGLRIYLKKAVWFDNSSPNTFFPRCYELSNGGSRKAFTG
jgi:tubulin monoglycylase TTLL3/8